MVGEGSMYMYSEYYVYAHVQVQLTSLGYKVFSGVWWGISSNGRALA